MKKFNVHNVALLAMEKDSGIVPNPNSKQPTAGWLDAGQRAEELTLEEFAEVYRRFVPS